MKPKRVPPLVSVLLPMRNAAPTIGRAWASLQAQTWQDWELVVVDDGSTDDSAQALRAVAAGDPRLRLVQDERRGLVAALNHGLALARGSLIARMDADDECHPERLLRQVEALRQRPEWGLVGCLVHFGGDRLLQPGYARYVDWLNGLVTETQVRQSRFVESPFAHPSVCFRRELVERYGSYRDGAFPEDYELWLRWLDAGVRMAKVEQTLLVWYDPPGRLSRNDPRYDREAFYRVKAPYLAREVARVQAGREVWIWGAGRPTRQRVAHLVAAAVPVAGYIDIDPRKVGRRLHGVPVVGPEDVPATEQALVLAYVANPGAREWIRDRLLAAGRVEGRDFLLAA